ncbi:MAG: hypothetical protein LDLANPLL_00650 [Turneriella sp.]|nr:hypothetical protein [Turneriella sp.]
MLFPITGFPLERRFADSLDASLVYHTRVHFKNFSGIKKFIDALHLRLDALFVVKAAYLSEVLYRILEKAPKNVAPREKTWQNVKKLLDPKTENSEAALCALVWLTAVNPPLKPLHALYANFIEIEGIDFLSRDAWGKALLKILYENTSSVDAQIEALIHAYADFFSQSERAFFLNITQYSLGARMGGGGEAFYSYALDAERTQPSQDSEWMQNLVLVSKIVPVWFADLYRRYGITVRRLDEIPEKELLHLKSLGVNGIWLVGLWERSTASARIKTLSGGKNYASAYSVFDYTVADAWGGEDALHNFFRMCKAHGIRLGCDMVPNHAGIDSKWLRENPDWFMQADFLPFPNYRFIDENLSNDPAMEIRIEKGYIEKNDAAVVFEHKKEGRTRYIYHGNDGTGLPWNDTAQLDHTHEVVRQKIIETALSLSRYFSIIRFDAAMTLTREHYRRLWFPEIGAPAAIQSRAAFALKEDDFNKKMSREFWVELTQAFRERNPDTLLLAEAFWMTELFFVRHLGMHRVYNSAFMHALRDEKNAEFEKNLRTFLEHDSETLARFVNYLSTPDEEAARTHFANDDKYFVAMTLMATLPGLPMLAPGQTEGYREKYGMDQHAPLLEESVDTSLIEKHRRILTPLFTRRHEFAEPKNLFFPRTQKESSIFCFITGATERFLVLVNNSAHKASGKIVAEDFIALFPKIGDTLVWENLFTNEELLDKRKDIASNGFSFSLGPYESRILTKFSAKDGVEKYPHRRYPQMGSYLSGVAVPVAALRSNQSVCVGEFNDLKLLVDWCVKTDQKIINLLPVNDTGYNSSPYSALSAMALNPVYISLSQLPLSDDLRTLVDNERARVQSFKRFNYYETVLFKEKILRTHYEKNPKEIFASIPKDFKEQNWLKDYALFRTLKDAAGGEAWFNWEKKTEDELIRTLSKNPTVEARIAYTKMHEQEINFYIWVQYILDIQFLDACVYARERGVFIKGDIPIMLEQDSVDVWLNPKLFNRRLRAGAPPDMFSPNGQNWGFPLYNWKEHFAENFAWWKTRIKSLDRYVAAYRIDHVLGFFRLWAIEEKNTSGIDGFFLPSLAFARETLLSIVGSEETLAYLSLVQIYEHERVEIQAAASSSLCTIGNSTFLAQNFTNENGILSLSLNTDFTNELLRRLHARAFIEFENQFYPAWEFEKRLWEIHGIDNTVRERTQEKIRVQKNEEAPLQHLQGVTILSALKEVSGMLPCAEDLGVVPEYVRPALEKLNILCLKVFRWEAENNVPIPPESYPYLSLATSSVHDSSNLREWLQNEESYITGIEKRGGGPSAEDVFTFLSRLYTSPSMVVMIPIQDLLALDETLHGAPEDERINIPGTVSEFNWTYRMPITLEELLSREGLITKVKKLVKLRPLV